MPSSAQPRLYRFGLYEADVRSGELRKNGVKQKIQGQPFEVLVALLQRPREVVTREELRARLWPEDTFVDFDHSLNTAINKVRDVLGDTAGNPRFLETLPRRGYRFIAPVQALDAAEERAGEAEETTKIQATDLVAMVDPPPQPVSPAPISEPELPQINRSVGRSLFVLIQIMYLVFYLVALWKLSEGAVGYWWLLIGIILSAVIGIPMRLYLLTAAAFDYRKLGANFLRLWPAVLFFDLLWALSPFLLLRQIGFGLAFGACAALLYVPFSQRTLVRMTYP
jgi:DNA-binding winged helix-turn-helix (wHTH) protein